MCDRSFAGRGVVVFGVLLVIVSICTCATTAKTASSPYGRVCEPTPDGRPARLRCDFWRYLHCHEKRRICLCVEPTPSLQASTSNEWDEALSSCVGVPKQLYGRCTLLRAENNGTYTHPQDPGKYICNLDGQCQFGTVGLGQHSRCRLETCTCECNPTAVYFNKRRQKVESAVRQIAGKCSLQKPLGEYCLKKEQCASIVVEGGRPAAVCTQDAICGCDQTTHVQAGEKCVRKVYSLDTDSCEYEEQCKALNEHATCVPRRIVWSDSETLHVCRCANGTERYEGNRCYHRRGYNENCTHDNECVLGLGLGAKCMPSPMTHDVKPFQTLTDTQDTESSSLPTEQLNTLKVCECGEADGSFLYDSSIGTCVVPAHVRLPKPTPAREGDHEQSKPANPNSMDWVKPTVITVSVTVMLIFLASALLVAYSKWNRRDRGSEHHGAATQPLLMREMLAKTDARFKVSEEDLDVDREAVLGSGQNGIVYRGFFKPRAIEVAVKTSKDNIASEMYLQAILEEAKILIHLAGHPNVVQFYGVCQTAVDGGNMCLICEICPQGSLESFLRGRRNLFEFWAPEDPTRAYDSQFIDRKLSFAHLYNWAYQIASAMEFVSARKVIHSDLAARNILLATFDCVKLTDFGLSRRLYDTYTYMKCAPEPLPWKWLDYDALRFMIFTTHTDVWSYGITLWEIWTLGDVPYPGIISPHCQDFMGQLLEGLHPTQPSYASDELYALMVKCWNTNPKGRPSFSWLKEELSGLMKKRRYTCTNSESQHQSLRSEESQVNLDDAGYLKPETTTVTVHPT